MPRILIIDDDPDILQATKLFLKQHAYTVDAEERPIYLSQLMKNQQYDLILLDMNFTRQSISGKEGFYWLDQILKWDPRAAVILITAYGDVEMAVKAVKKGATDFILKPWKSERLLSVIEKVLQIRSRKLAAVQQPQTLDTQTEYAYPPIIGESQVMQQVMATVEKIATTDANVLILGENGTGKELVASALHAQSLRKQEIFINVDMGAISETLFESELFGHVKGAFTDAREDRIGRFELASGGTLFLDEIGNLSLAMQAKLLNVLQNRKVVRLGSNTEVPIDIRLICATNLPIHHHVKTRSFRQDLLYRINTVEIKLPPLRERQDDIPLLAQHFCKRYAEKYQKPIRGISQTALVRLQKYQWPGNIRELQHAIERAVILTESEWLQASDFLFQQDPSSNEELQLDSYNLEEVEKMVIRKVISKHGGNISQAARELGLTRTSLYRRIEKYGL